MDGEEVGIWAVLKGVSSTDCRRIFDHSGSAPRRRDAVLGVSDLLSCKSLGARHARNSATVVLAEWC